jgi:hypothetical protein
LTAGLHVKFDNAAAVSVPAFVASAAGAAFVAETSPRPVVQLTSTAVLLEPRNLKTGAVFTAEMVASSNAENLVQDALLRSVACALDATLFDANPATASRPAGVLNGITPITPIGFGKSG